MPLLKNSPPRTSSLPPGCPLHNLKLTKCCPQRCESVHVNQFSVRTVLPVLFALELCVSANIWTTQQKHRKLRAQDPRHRRVVSLRQEIRLFKKSPRVQNRKTPQGSWFKKCTNQLDSFVSPLILCCGMSSLGWWKLPANKERHTGICRWKLGRSSRRLVGLR